MLQLGGLRSAINDALVGLAPRFGHSPEGVGALPIARADSGRIGFDRSVCSDPKFSD